jgi:hypothetical protein
MFLGVMAMSTNSYASKFCTASEETVTTVDNWLHSPLEITLDAIFNFHIIPALEKDSCITSKLNKEEVVALAYRLANDVLLEGYNVKEVIQEFLAE